jgi:hypothetical protein
LLLSLLQLFVAMIVVVVIFACHVNSIDIQASLVGEAGGLRGGLALANKGMGALGKVAGPLGTVLMVGQAGKILTESINDRAQFEALKRKGVYDEALASRLAYAKGDLLLGRGTTKAIAETCFKQGTFGQNVKSCTMGTLNVAKGLAMLPVVAVKV